MFTKAAPDHIAGWGNFEHWLSSNNLNSVQQANLKLYRILENKIGTVSSYAEFGCPFQCLLMLFKAHEETPAGRLTLFAKAMQREPDVRWTKVTQLHQRATRWANWLVMGYHRIRAIKESIWGGKTASVTDTSVSSLPAVRLLLTQDTNRAWGNNCVRYGGSCRYFAGQVLGADGLPFNETVDQAVREERATVDLLGIFNSLDYTSDPLAVIRNGLKLARHIVIATHHASYAGKQHQYAFGENFPQLLTTMLDGAVVEDSTDIMIDHGRRSIFYILISLGKK